MMKRKSLVAAVGVLGLMIVGCEEKKAPAPAPKAAPKAPAGATGSTAPTTPPSTPAPK